MTMSARLWRAALPRQSAARRHFSSSTKDIVFHWVDFRGSGFSILERLLIEEALLRHDTRNWLLVGHHVANAHRVLRPNIVPTYMNDKNENLTSAIVLGIGGKPEKLLHLDLVKADGCVCIKRFSGGGTVVLDADSIWTSIVARPEDVQIEQFPRPIMAWTAQHLFAHVFDKLQAWQFERSQQTVRDDLSLQEFDQMTLVTKSPSCGASDIASEPLTIRKDVNDGGAQAIGPSSHDFNLRDNDYVLGERKMGGNAQAITKQGWIHHTSFLWDYQPENMAYLTMPDRRPAYRADRNHHDFLVKLCEAYPQLRPCDFYQAMKDCAKRNFTVQNVTPREALQVLEPLGGLQTWFEKGSRTKMLFDLPEYRK